MTKQTNKAKPREIKFLKRRTIWISENLEKSLERLAAVDERDYSSYVRRVLNEHVRQKESEGVLPITEVSVQQFVEKEIKGPITNRPGSRKTRRRKRQPPRRAELRFVTARAGK